MSLVLHPQTHRVTSRCSTAPLFQPISSLKQTRTEGGEVSLSCWSVWESQGLFQAWTGCTHTKPCLFWNIRGRQWNPQCCFRGKCAVFQLELKIFLKIWDSPECYNFQSKMSQNDSVSDNFQVPQTAPAHKQATSCFQTFPLHGRKDPALLL